MHKAISGIIGGTLGLLVGGLLVWLVFVTIVDVATGDEPISSGDMTDASFLVFLFGPVAGGVGAIAGLAIGAVGGTAVGRRIGKWAERRRQHE